MPPYVLFTWIVHISVWTEHVILFFLNYKITYELNRWMGSRKQVRWIILFNGDGDDFDVMNDLGASFWVHAQCGPPCAPCGPFALSVLEHRPWPFVSTVCMESSFLRKYGSKCTQSYSSVLAAEMKRNNHFLVWKRWISEIQFWIRWSRCILCTSGMITKCHIYLQVPEHQRLQHRCSLWCVYVYVFVIIYACLFQRANIDSEDSEFRGKILIQINSFVEHSIQFQ